MTVALRGISSRVSGTGTTISLTNDVPALADGDYMVMLIYANLGAATAPTPPGDWSLIDEKLGGLYYIRAYGKIAVSEPGSYTITRNAGTKTYAAGLIAFYSDDAQSLYVDAHANQANASSTNRTCPGVTTTKTSAGLICAFNLSANLGSTPPGDMTEQWDELLSVAVRVYAMTAILTSSGATGDKVATGITPASSRCVTVAIAETDPPSGDPSGLGSTATAFDQIDLTWTDGSSNETGFELEEGPNGSDWALLTTTAADVVAYSHTGLTEHSVHYYRVRAVNDDGNSGYSNTANTTTLIKAPSALSAVQVGPTQINLSWTNNSGVTPSVSIERSPNGSSSWAEITTVAAGVSTYSNTGLTADTSYWYRIRAYISTDFSAYSSSAVDTTPLYTPTSLVATPTLSTKIVLTWADALNGTEDGYKVERSDNGTTGWAQIGTTAANVLTYDDTVTPSSLKYYRVRAYHSTNHSAYSSTANATSYAALVAPSALAASDITPSAITLSWSSNGNLNLTGYSLERSPNGTTGWAEIVTQAGTTYTNSGLSSSTPYWYRVRAYRTGSTEYSSYSSIVSAETLLSQPVPDRFRLFLLQPTTVFAARVNQATITYPLDQVTFDTVTVGAYTAVQAGMTVLFGTSAGASDLGRQRIRKVPTSAILYIGRSSKDIFDGEIDIEDNSFITVLDDYRIWSKIPFIDSDGTIYKDSDLVVGDETTDPPPVANCGPGTAATIDGTITVQFVGTNSFAVATGATIATYLWDVDDGTITVGTSASSTITATFPAGFRWVSLTVTDSNDKTHTARCPVFARDPDADVCISPFEIETHRITPQGQQLSVRIRQDIPISTYPDGTLVMLWDSEPASASDRSHMQFIGWIQSEPLSHQAQRTAFLQDTVLECLDVAGRLDTLPGFPQIIEANAAPDVWTEMLAPNIDKYLHYLLHWHSTALELADWTDSGTGSDFPFVVLSSDGASLLDQVSRRAGALVPDHMLTCNRRGQLQTPVDPMLQDSADRTATEQVEFTLGDWSQMRYARQRPPRVHWLRANALQASASTVTALFAIAPGDTPGQGVAEQTHSEQLAISQAALNAVTGHRYARLNSVQGRVSIALAASSAADALEPADLTWVRVTVLGAQRSGSAGSRGLVHELSIRYDHARTGLVKNIDLQWEQETAGNIATTVVIPTIDPVDGGGWDPTPTPPIEGPPPVFPSGLQNVAVINNHGEVFTTVNFQDTPPTWAVDSSIYSGGQVTTIDPLMSFVVDPFSPLYRGTGTTVRGFACNRHHIFRIDDMFSVAGGVSATSLYDFDDFILIGDRKIMASFGRYFDAEVDNPWLMCVSFSKNVFDNSYLGTYTVSSKNAGRTWGDIVHTPDGHEWVDFDNSTARPALWMSPRTPGLALTAGWWTQVIDPAFSEAFITRDWGASWSRRAAGDTGDVFLGNDLGHHFLVPWADNADESLIYGCYSEIVPTPSNNQVYHLMRNNTDISPVVASKKYGPWRFQFSVTAYDNDRQFIILAGRTNEVDDSEFGTNNQHAVFVSDDAGDTWTVIVAPISAVPNAAYPTGVSFADDTEQVIYIWGNSRYVKYSNDFGVTVLDKEGNIGSIGFGGDEEILGFVGGDTV